MVDGSGSDQQSSRRQFLAQVVVAGHASLLAVTQRVAAQEAFQRAAVDRSLKGRLIYYTRSAPNEELSPGLYAYDFENRTFAPIVKDVQPDAFCRASPDGKSFAMNEGTVGEEEASIVRPEGRTRVCDGRARLFWSPDGRQVIVSEWKDDPVIATTWRMNADGTGRVPVPVPKNELVTDWSPDGQWLLLVKRRDDPTGQLGHGPNKPMFLRRVDGSEPRLLIENNPGGSGLGRFSPDSRSIAYTRVNHKRGDYSLRVVDVATGQERTLLDDDGQEHPNGNLCWSPDGKFLAVRMMHPVQADAPAGLGHIEIVDLQGRRIRALGIPQRISVPCNWQ